MRPVATRALIGALAGATATLALASVLRRFGRDDGPLDLADIVRGAAAGALIAALDARPGRITGALAGGGLWLASELTHPAVAIRPARPGETKGAVLLAAHLAWGWTAAEAIRKLDEGLAQSTFDWAGGGSLAGKLSSEA
jgi:hypothetical protein